MAPPTTPPESSATPGMPEPARPAAGASASLAGRSDQIVDTTRRWINQHGALVVVGCVGMLLASWAILPHNETRREPPKLVYYLDPATQMLIAGPAMVIPPLEIDGKEAVRVHVFACDDCGEQFIGYYEKFSPEAKKRLEEISRIMQEEGYFSDLDSEAYELHWSGRLVSSDSKQWVRAESWEGRRVMRYAEREDCGEGKLIACYPTDPEM